MDETFSDRHNYSAPAAEITLRESAPSALREALIMLAHQHGLTYSDMREVICETLLVIPDPTNWTEVPNVRDDVSWLMMDCHWFTVYDIAEKLHANIARRSTYSAAQFANSLNRFFSERGIGWELQDGEIVFRGEAFTETTKSAVAVLEETGRPTAANELREAIRDISRRPDPDVTGAIQHSMSALEATARNVAGRPNPTLGQLVPQLNLPRPLDEAVSKLWGYASDRARHGSEDREVAVSEAELVVSVAAAVCTFLVRRQQTNGAESD